MENIIYNQDGWIIVDVQSTEDIERYGPEDIQKELIQDWVRIFRDGDFYIIINGNDRWFMFKNKNGDIKYYDRDFDDVDKNEFKSELEYNEFTGFNFIEKNITGYGKLFQLLVKIVKGEEVDRYSYGDYDKLIYDINIDRQKPAKSKITIVFEDEDKFFDLFEVNPDDKWFINYVRSYDGYSFIDDYTASEDWKEGYVLREINDENRQRLNDIVKLISPGIDIENDAEVSSVLYDHFEDRVDNIVVDWGSLMNRAGNEYANKLIQEDFGDVFYHYGIVEIIPMYKYKTSVGILLTLMMKKFDNRSMTIYDIFNTIAPKDNYSISSERAYEYMYEGNFDNEQFNLDVDYEINKMEKELEERLDEYKDPQEYKQIYDYITSRYKFGNYYPHPLDKDKQDKSTFVVNGIDPSDNKITVSVYKPDGGKKDTRSLTMDEFTRFLSQYELFEGENNQYKKIILEQLNNNQDKILVKQFMDTLTPSSKELTKDDINLMINRYNLQNPKQPKLNLDKVLNTPTDSKFKIDLLGITALPDGKQKVIKTAELKLNDKFIITIQRNPLSGQTLPGMKINF
jgi:hypothetical protein